MKSLQGHLLVASPHLPDPNFFRSVVLMVQHHAEGAFGLVLNRPSQSSIKDTLGKISEVKCATDEVIGVGGPVEGPLMAVHRNGAYSEEEVLEGVYFTRQRDHILQIVGQPDQPCRLFSGFAGWGSGQLESELRIGGWLTAMANVDYIFHTSTDALWKKVSGDIGGHILQQAINVKNAPSDPSLN